VTGAAVPVARRAPVAIESSSLRITTLCLEAGD
jgi:hypothetical protein